MDLSAQFQPALPGLDALKPQRGVPGVVRHLARPGFVDQSGQKYSGPIPGQRVMGATDLGGDAVGHPALGRRKDPFYTVDAAGMVPDQVDTGLRANRGLESPVDVAGGHHEKFTTYGFYSSLGGGMRGEPDVDKHWDSQPLHHVPSDTPVHTGQDVEYTLYGDSRWQVEEGLVHPRNAEGRQRINAIRATLQHGEPIRKEAWLARRNGRLYALDGHHRILAAREEGHPTYPARIWDVDAEDKPVKP